MNLKIACRTLIAVESHALGASLQLGRWEAFYQRGTGGGPVRLHRRVCREGSEWGILTPLGDLFLTRLCR